MKRPVMYLHEIPSWRRLDMKNSPTIRGNPCAISQDDMMSRNLINES
jgi:hypothetical protein